MASTRLAINAVRSTGSIGLPTCRLNPAASGLSLIFCPRITGASGFASLGFFRSYLTYAHVLVVPLGFALAAIGGWPRAFGAPLLFSALLFSTARGAWIAAGAMVVTLVAVRHGGNHAWRFSV